MSKDACPDACGQLHPAAAAFFGDAATRWGWLWAPNILRLRRLWPAAAGTARLTRHVGVVLEKKVPQMEKR